MATLNFNAAKRLFFDREEVARRVAPAARRVLSKFGAFVRRRARSSIRFRKKGFSQAGSPPFSHTRDPFATIRNILFALDATRNSVVIGPVRLNGRQYLNGILSRGTIPEVLEYGGFEGIREKQRYAGGPWRGLGTTRALRPGERIRVRQARYEARPFMRPAFAAESQNILSLWKGSIRKTA